MRHYLKTTTSKPNQANNQKSTPQTKQTNKTTGSPPPPPQETHNETKSPYRAGARETGPDQQQVFHGRTKYGFSHVTVEQAH